MKNKILLITVGAMISVQLAYSQVPVQSIDSLKQQERIAEITLRIDKNKLKLAQLETELAEKKNNEQKALQQAKESAEENRKAAVTLSNDPQDKKKAVKAERQSDDAKRDTKKARRASKKFKGIEKEINVLKKRIAKDENTLSGLRK